MRARLPVFYTPRMVASSECYSPSADKPAKVVTSWLSNGFPIEILESIAATSRELSLAHDPEHVRAVLEGRASNGFGNRSPSVAASLPYTTGAMLSAARWVLAGGGAAAAPCSGFHHAGYAYAGAFCTFNGLMVSACVLRQEGKVRRVGILDCDHHYGDGTDDIVAKLGAQSWVRHFSSGARYRLPEHVEPFFDWLPTILEELAKCDLVLYQAGADPHTDDPLGGWLTTDELQRRDALVFDALRESEVPLVWNLAGGYQKERDGSIPKVLEIHDNTAREWIRAYGSES